MASLKDIETAITTSMKAGNKERTATLRLLASTVKGVAKNDGNRDPTDEDVITAANRMIKQARETLSFLEQDSARQSSVIALRAEIETVQEFLPKQMSREELDQLLAKLVEEGRSGENPKAVRGHVMKVLNTLYRGQYDAKQANEILTEKIS